MTFKRVFNYSAADFEWHQLYYVLAFIDIATIIAALMLTQSLMNTYEKSVESNRLMSMTVSEFAKLGYIAQDVNEPGNRIFETRDPQTERVALAESKRLFDQAYKVAYQNLERSFTSEQVTRIEENSQLLNLSMEAMVAESAKIFTAVELNDMIIAGQHMSIMDAHYYKVAQAFGHISQYISEIQNLHFQEQLAKAKSIKRYEVAIAIVVLVIITLVTVYGHKLGKRLKANAKQIEQALQTAQQSAKAKEMFLANMSHEIRTPMNAILGMLKLINDKDLTKETSKYLALASSSAENLMVIINDILDLSKFEQDQLTLEIVPFNVCELIEQQVSMYKHVHDQDKVKLTSDVSGVAQSWLKGDFTRLIQVINNLLNNAFKFTKEGKITLSVVTKSHDKSSDIELTIAVSDSGIGIGPDKLDSIFDVFTQADSSTTREYGGTGLGLAISKRICNIMHGDLTVTSELGKGSCFTAKTLLASLPSDEIPEPINDPSEDQEAFFEPLNIHLLVAEDNRVNQILIKKLLDKMGCSYDVASNGQDAIEMLNESHNTILMDCLMPVMDGFEATQQIRNLENSLSNVPIIAVTANSMPDDKQKCLDIGMNAYVSKPIEFDTLYVQLKKINVGLSKKVS